MIQPIGTLGTLNQSAGMALDAQKYMGESLMKLGGVIGQTIAERQMYGDAEKLAPFMQQSFMESYDKIAGGDFAGGLGNLMQTSAQVSTNPILARISQEGVRTGALLMNQYMDLQQTEIMAGRTSGRQGAALQNAITRNQSDLSQAIAAFENAPEEARPMLQQTIQKLQAEAQSLRQQAVSPVAPRVGPTTQHGEPSFNLNEPVDTITAPQPQSTQQADLPIEQGEDLGGIMQAWGTMTEEQRAQAATSLKEKGMSITGTDVNGQPIIVNDKAAAQQQTQTAPTPANAPQQASGQAILFSEPLTQVVFGGNGYVSQDSGKKMELTGQTVNNEGKMTMTFQMDDGPKEITLGKEATEARKVLNEESVLINSDVASWLGSFKGVSNIPAIDITGTKDTGYSVSIKVPVEKNGKKVMDEVECGSRDENGKFKKSLIDEETKNRIERVKSATSTLKSAFLSNGVQIKYVDDVNAPQDAKMAAAMDMANQPFPFQLNETETIKSLGADPSKMKEGDLIAFKANALTLLDKMEESGAFQDPKNKGAEIPLDQQVVKYQQKLKKEAKDWKVGDALMLPPNKEKEVPTNKTPDLDPRLRKEADEPDFLQKLGGSIAGAAKATYNTLIGEPSKFISDAKSVGNANKKHYVEMAAAMKLLKSGVFSQEEYDSEMTKIEKQIKDELAQSKK